MKDVSIFAATLGLSQSWKITSVNFAKEVKRLDITVEYLGASVLACPHCGRASNTTCSEKESWYHDNFFRYHTYLHARIPCLECSCGGTLNVERPWSRVGSKFTRLN